MNTVNAKQIDFGAPAVAAPVFQVRLDRPTTVRIKFENPGAQKQAYDTGAPESGNALVTSLEDSADGVVWAAVAATSRTTRPLGTTDLSVRVRNYFRILAAGSCRGMAKVECDSPCIVGIQLI